MFSMTPWRKKNGSDGGALVPRLESPLAWFRDEFDALFDRFFGRGPLFAERDWPATALWGLDVEDTDKEVIVRAEAPGFEVADFNVHVSGNLLTIQAERKHESKQEREDYHFAERHFGRFQRSLTLPTGIDPNKVEARYHNGILEMHFGKSPEAQGRRIEVKS